MTTIDFAIGGMSVAGGDRHNSCRSCGAPDRWRKLVAMVGTVVSSSDRCVPRGGRRRRRDWARHSAAPLGLGRPTYHAQRRRLRQEQAQKAAVTRYAIRRPSALIRICTRERPYVHVFSLRRAGFIDEYVSARLKSKGETRGDVIGGNNDPVDRCCDCRGRRNICSGHITRAAS
jgi:hypothetical protein